ncbi:hypothetical protein [Pseudomonas viridiflava]
MADYTELKRLAEACGDLNWRAIQENWCEWAIRDDHGYIATMRTKSAKHPGPCPDREAKAKFLCAVTPAAVLALIAENDRLRVRWENPDPILIQCMDSAIAEHEQLERDAERYRWLRDRSVSIHQFYLSTPIWFTGVKFSKENVDSTIDAAMGKGEQP